MVLAFGSQSSGSNAGISTVLSTDTNCRASTDSATASMVSST